MEVAPPCDRYNEPAYCSACELSAEFQQAARRLSDTEDAWAHERPPSGLHVTATDYAPRMGYYGMLSTAAN